MYVTSGTRAEKVARRNPAKRVRYVDYQPSRSTAANFELGLRQFDPARAATTTVTLRFELPDGTVDVGIADGRIVTTLDGPATGEVPAAVVRVTSTSYIGLLHGRTIATDDQPAYVVDGDPAALGALLACLETA